MKKELIAYALALTALVGYNSLKKNEERIVPIITKSDTSIEVKDDAYSSYFESISYDGNIDDDKNNNIITENNNSSHEKITGQFYLIIKDSIVYDNYGNVMCFLEKNEKIILINNNINEYNYAYIQLSNGYKGYVNYSNLNLLSDKVIDLKQDYYFNSFNDNNINTDNENKSIQPSVYKFAKKNNYLYDWDGEIICSINKDDIVKMIDKSFDNAYIELPDGTRGFINNNLLYIVPETFVEVDISEQTLYDTKVLIHK